METKEVKHAELMNLILGKDVQTKVTHTLYGCEKDEKGEVVKTMREVRDSFGEKPSQEIVEEHTKVIVFEYVGVSVAKLLAQHSSTTTIFKKYYNDNLFQITDKDWLAMPDEIHVNVAELLESKRQPASASSAGTKYQKALEAKVAVLTPEQKEQERARIQAMLDMLS